MHFTLTPVSGDAFADRTRIVEEFVSELVSRQSRTGFALTGIRRVGKSSILREVRRRLATKGIPTVFLSVWEVTPFTLDEFLGALVDKTVAEFESYLPWKLRLRRYLSLTGRAFSDLLASLKVSARIGEHLELTFSYLRGEQEDVGGAIHHAFALPEALARECGKKCVVMLDEFPSITDLSYGKRNQRIGDSIVKALRSDYEDFQRTALVISGSIRHTFRAVLGPTGALWKQLLRREIQPFTVEETLEFVRKYVLRGRNLQAYAAVLWRATGGIPYNLQLICRKLVLEGIEFKGDADVAKAVREVLREEGRLHFREYLQEVIPSEAKVLIQLASGRTAPSEIAKAAGMDLSAVTGLLRSLLDKGFVVRQERGSYRIVDPLFAEWLKSESAEQA